MYAIVDIAGQQFKVEKDQKLYVHRLEAEEGKKVSFDQVLLIDNNGKVAVGDPVVKGAAVSATVLAHVKGDKVLVFKKKRRKGYQKLNGHRQQMTQIQIESISEKAAAKAKAAPKAAKADAPKAAAADTEKKAPAKKAGAADPKAAAEKKATAEKKAPAKKAAAAKKPAAEKKAAADKKAAAPKKETAAKKPAAKKSAAADPKKDAEEK